MKSRFLLAGLAVLALAACAELSTPTTTSQVAVNEPNTPTPTLTRLSVATTARPPSPLREDQLPTATPTPTIDPAGELFEWTVFDGNYVVECRSDIVKLRQVDTSEYLRSLTTDESGCYLSFAPDNSALALIGLDGVAHIWFWQNLSDLQFMAETDYSYRFIPQWAPNSKRVAFIRLSQPNTDDETWLLIDVIAPETGVTLTIDSQVSYKSWDGFYWLSDSQTIGFNCWPGCNGHNLFDANTGAVMP